MPIFFHELLLRTPTIMARLKDFPVTVCGGGALGQILGKTLLLQALVS
ncbi:hypothetical protein AVDCRST_MAG92-1205 [uncultured Coleofasciculus sp.]|uniref:Uncharacterized protein n=1 Tax=uncultured Coleofasciculus sp. TaxID=1267456 RepID=A0A6J4HVI4_9CYAN|nr:hypothetical protein AVDCRST_MAG92-1205 [uncultured Coleofasciculus sp.]